MIDADLDTSAPIGEADGHNIAPAGDAAVEESARRMGWRPKDEFRGPVEKWRPADEFLERGLNELPVMRDRYRKLEETFVRETTQLKGQVSQLSEVANELREFSTKAEQRAYEKAKRELEDKRDAAVAHADVDTYRQTQAEIAALEAPKVPTKVDQPAVLPSEVTEWVSANPWFNSDPFMAETAKQHEALLGKMRPDLSLKDRLAETRAHVMRAFPDKFENKRRETAAAVGESNSAPAPKTKGKGYADLPADARKQCDKLVATMPPDKTGKKYTREDYCKVYFAGEE